jgi:dTDP-4-amino-4,6-dideoxygalactose transaminase
MEKYKKIPLSTPHMSEEGYELKFVLEAFESNWIAPLGPMVDSFEQDIINYTGSKYAVALSSGTAAIHLALKAVGIQEGDIIFCQSLTFSATANPIIYERAIPVFIDSEEDTWNMSPLFLEEAFKKYPRVKAVIVVHLYGMPSKIEEISLICRKFNVALIEVAAESLGSKFKGIHTGTFGELGVLSFNGNKIITTSGGGMVISNDREKIEKIRFWATQSRDNARHYQHSELGYNYRMSNILAAIGRGQLKVLDQRINKRRHIFQLYKSLLNEIQDISFITNNNFNYYSNFWLTSLLLKNKNDVVPLIEFLQSFNIETRPLWKPMHLQPFYSKYDFIGDRISDNLFYRGICLPSDSKLKDEDISFVSKKIISFFKM